MNNTIKTIAVKVATVAACAIVGHLAVRGFRAAEEKIRHELNKG